MNDNLKILSLKLDHLDRMQRDIDYSVGKMGIPLAKIKSGTVDSLTESERETLSAFNSRFSSYQEQIAKKFVCIAVEEELSSERFGVILALMEKLGIIDDVSKWRVVRELRNAANHIYQDDADLLFQALNNMIVNVPYLHNIYNQLRIFVQTAYFHPS